MPTITNRFRPWLVCSDATPDGGTVQLACSVHHSGVTPTDQETMQTWMFRFFGFMFEHFACGVNKDDDGSEDAGTPPPQPKPKLSVVKAPKLFVPRLNPNGVRPKDLKGS